VLVRDGDAWELFESYLITGTPNSLFRGVADRLERDRRVARGL
jgi:hypothetical protein